MWNRRTIYPTNAVYVGRGTPWGNPFVIGKHGDRDEVCDRFEQEVLPTLDVSPLIGRDLVCWCAPKRCHADAILQKANASAIEAATAGETVQQGSTEGESAVAKPDAQTPSGDHP